MRFGLGLVSLALSTLVFSCRSSLEKPTFERFDPAISPGANDYPDVGGVVLLDRGTLFLTVQPSTGNPIARLRRLRRVKILRESGRALAQIVVPYEAGTAVASLRARALLPDGTPVEADEDTVRDVDQEAGGFARAITVPVSDPGTIIEHTYDLWIADPRFITPWIFQSSMPTLRSEYSVVAPPGFDVDLRFSQNGVFENRAPDRFETEDGARFVWSMSNLPALFTEPGMASLELLAPRAHVLMLGARVGRRDYPGFSSWDDVAKWFVSLAPNWAQLSSASIQEAKRVAGDSSVEEQALNLHALVARDLAWEPGPKRPIWQTRVVPAETVLKEKRGNATTRGLLLVALLRAVGIPAHPGLVAYRDRGLLLPDAPTPNALDAVVAVVPRGQGTMYLDPNQLTVSADVPAPRIQGTRIIGVREEGADVVNVPISSAAHSRTSIGYELKVEDDGSVTGTIDARLTGAEAGTLREALFSSKPESYAEAVSAFLLTRGAALQLDNASIADLAELGRPLSVKGKINVRRMLRGEGTSVPVKLERIIGSDDPQSKREVRRTALQIGAPHSVEINATLALPDGWQVESTPEPFEASWAGGHVSLRARAENERRILLKRESELAVTEVSPSEYLEYRQFRGSTRAAETQALVVKRRVRRNLEY